MKQINIDIPQGYEIDREKSTFENIVFKEIKGLPTTWEDLKTISGHYVVSNSIMYSQELNTYSRNKNMFATKEQAEASLALAQLSQLRDVYRQGWTPDWGDNDWKHVIEFHKDKLIRSSYRGTNNFLAFQSKDIRDEFLENFKDLIEQAKPFL